MKIRTKQKNNQANRILIMMKKNIKKNSNYNKKVSLKKVPINQGNKKYFNLNNHWNCKEITLRPLPVKTLMITIIVIKPKANKTITFLKYLLI